MMAPHAPVDGGDCEATLSRVRATQERWQRERQTLSRLSNLLHGLPNPEAVLNLATGFMATALDARRAVAFLYANGATSVASVSGYNYPANAFSPSMPRPAADFALEREALAAGSAVAKAGIEAPDTRLGYSMAGAFAVVPLQRERAHLGCLYLSRNPAQANFDAGDISFLNDLAERVAAAIDVARMFVQERRRSEEAEALIAMASSAASQALTTASDWTLTMATWTLPCDLALITLAGEDEACLDVVAARGQHAGDYDGLRLPVDDSGNGAVFRTQRPLLADTIERSRFASILQLGTRRFASLVAVPLTAAGKPLGTLCMAREAEPGFTPADLRQLEALSGQVVVAIQNALQFEAEQRRRVGAEALATIAASFSVGLPASDMLEILAREALGALDVSSCGIWLVDREASNLSIAAFASRGEPALQALRGLEGDERAYQAATEVLAGGRMVAIGDATSAPEPLAQFCSDRGARSLIAVPIPGQPEPLGLLVAGRERQSRPWHDDELRLAGALAGQASAVLVNARLYANEQQRAAREERLRAVARELSGELSFDGFLTVLGRNLETLTGLKNYRVTVWNDQASRLETCLLVKEGQRVAAAEGVESAADISRYLVDSGETMLSDDYAAEAARRGLVILDEELRRPGRALFGMPLQARGRAVGTLIVWRWDGPISPDTVSILETLSGQIGTALENVRLYAATERHRDEEQAFNAIARDLAGSVGVGPLLNRIAEHACGLVGANFAELLLFDPRRQVIVAQAVHGADPEPFVQQLMPTASGFVGQIWSEGRPRATEDYFADTSFEHNAQLDALTRQAGLVSLVGSPIALADERLGVIVVGSNTPRSFTRRDEEVLARLATLAALSVRNARLYDEARERARRLEMLNEIGRELSSELELDRFVEIAWRQVTRLMDVKDCWIALTDRDSLDLDYCLFVTDGVRRPEWEKVRGAGLGRALIEGGKTIHVDDYIQECVRRGLTPSGPLAHRTNMAWLGVPLITGGRAVGAIAIWRMDRPFTADEKATLETLMEQMAPSLENTLRFRRAHDLASRDPLTGLLNHRAQQERLDEELARAGRHHHPVAVIMLDLDNFKMFNDTYGHPGGDRILRAVAEILKFEARGSDSVGRYGGDEFMLVLPETGAEGALALIERVQSRLAVLHRELGFAGAAPLATSAGLAVFPADASRREELVALADAALYVSKRGGGRPVAVNEHETRTEPSKRGRGGFEVLAELVRAIDAKDGYTQHHSEIVAEAALLLAESLGLSPDQHEALRVAGLLHDVGMIGVPPDVLRKVAPLTETEWKQLREHILCGELLVRGAPELVSSIDPVMHHHERWDGRGYPRGLAGDAVPLLGRILSVAEAYAAMVQDRPRGQRLSSEEVIAQLRGGASTQFDPELVAILTAAIERGDLPHTARHAASA